VEAARVRAAILAGAIVLALPAVAQAQEGTPVVGGGSYNTAPLLKPGRYADTVAAGETVYWKVALAKGQVLRVRATVDTSEVETDSLANDYLEGIANLDYRLDLFTPLREQVADESEWSDGNADLEGDDEAGAKTGEAVSPRALGFEQILGTDFSLAKFPAPGEWYISLSAADSEIYPAEVPAELPVELEVTVEGTAEPSSADFASRLPGPTPEPTPDAATPAQVLAGGDAGAGDPAVTIALVGALALLGGLGLGVLASRLLVR
jgi:Ca-activated chloride channel homolog